MATSGLYCANGKYGPTCWDKQGFLLAPGHSHGG
jgi:hypothetical protein